MSGRLTDHNHLALRRFHLRVVFAATTVAVLTVSCSAAAVWLAERHAPRSNIKGFWTAAWWAMETVTTVGYGDHHPTTTVGRFVAVGLMVVGVALVGVITATVVTWLFSELDVMRDVREIEEVEEKTEATLEVVLVELARIQERLDRLDGAVRDSAAPEVPNQLSR